MRIHEILLEMTFGQLNYGSWIIRYEKEKNATGAFKAMGTNLKIQGTFAGEAQNMQQAIDQVKNQIKERNDSDREERRTDPNNINPNDVTKVQIAFNRQFTRDILTDGPTAARFNLDATGNPQLILMNADYFGTEDVQDYITDLGMIRLQWLIDKKQTANSTDGYTIMLGPRRTIENDLEFGGRYYVNEVQSDNEVYRTFDIMLDSITLGPKDRVQLKGPGFTVATWVQGQKIA